MSMAATRILIPSLTISLLWVNNFALSFDNDYEISSPNFRLETFVDIKSYEISKRLSDQWYEEESGWRVASGSLDFDRLYLHSQFKLQQPLSNLLKLRLKHEEETYYDIKPAQRTEIELALSPFSAPLEFSFIGTPTYDKRQSDLGLAIGLGTRPWGFIQLSHVQQDLYYNEKNVYDQSEYRRIPEVTKLVGGYEYEAFRLKYLLSRDHPLWLQTSDDGQQPLDQNFRSHGHQYDFNLDYVYGDSELVGFRSKGFWQKKSLNTNTSATQQVLYHRTLESYWLSNLSPEKHLTLGLQFDEFGDRINSTLGSETALYDTLQAYGVVENKLNQNASWMYAAFIGDANKKQEHNTEAKLRFSWHYQSDDDLGHFICHVSINLDEYAQWEDAADAWNGGGISYQVSF